MASTLHILEITSSLRRQRVFRDRLNALDEYSDGEFIARYRITHYIFTELINEIPSKLLSINNAFPFHTSNNTTGRSTTFLETGTFQK